MRMILLTSVLLVGVPAAAQAPAVNNYPASQSAYNPTTTSNVTQSATNKWRQSLVTIRADAVRQRTADGGTLTLEHRATLQQRIDAANRRYAGYVAPACGGTRLNCDLSTGQRPTS